MNDNPFAALGLPSGSIVAELLYLASGIMVVQVRDPSSNHQLWWRWVASRGPYVRVVPLEAGQSLTSPKVSTDGRGVYCLLNVGHVSPSNGWSFGGLLYLEPATGVARKVIEAEIGNTQFYVADILAVEPQEASLICVVGRQLPGERVMTYRVERFVLSDRRFEVICELETPFG